MTSSSTSLPNVIFCIFDTMRRDAIGAYGGHVNTPNLDSFSNDAVIYNDGITSSPWTFPSHISFFSGKYATDHGLHESFEAKGSDLWRRKSEVEMIPQSLAKLGYTTIGISGNSWLYPGSIFSRGYDFFTCVEGDRVSKAERAAIREASKYGNSAKEIAWHMISHGRFGELARLYGTYRDIKNREKKSNYPAVKGGDRIAKIIKSSSFEEPFFLFINFFEMHDPYTSFERDSVNKSVESQPGLSLADLLGFSKIGSGPMAEIRKQYYNESSYVDRYFGELTSWLKDKGLYDNCLLITSSDHGQALKERNYYGHSIYLYDEIVRVPLIVKYPRNVKPAIKEGYQSLVNIPRLIKGVIEGDFSDHLTEPVVFSESFGIPQPSIRKVPEDLRKRYDVSRKAVFKDGYKMTVNWSDMSVEELTYKGKPLEINDKKELRESLLNEFSVLGTQEIEAFSPSEESEVLEKLRDLGYA